MTAPCSKFDAGKQFASEAAIRHVSNLCNVATNGRRAIRALSQWCESFELGEPEFQVLWCLREGMTSGVDQTSLVKRLAISPSQVSATVERLRARGWILQQPASGDRRRNLWHLSLVGSSVIVSLLESANELLPDLPCGCDRSLSANHRREAA